MTLLDSIILGIVQGLTEFVPISSSGHLIIAREFFNISLENSVFFDVMLHLATLLAVIIYFWKDIWQIKMSFWNWIFKKQEMPHDEKVMTISIIVGTIPAVFFGFFLQDMIETTFRNATLVAWALIAGSVLFAFAERVGKQDKELTVKKGFLIGFFQSLALIPGMSRSGSSIAGGLILGLDREKAARFSFLLAIPIFIGVALKKIIDIGGLPNEDFSILIAGSLSAFIVGMLAIHYLLKFLRNHSLYIFVWYRVALAFLIFWVL